jgi:hypothetical protein
MTKVILRQKLQHYGIEKLARRKHILKENYLYDMRRKGTPAAKCLILTA